MDYKLLIEKTIQPRSTPITNVRGSISSATKQTLFNALKTYALKTGDVIMKVYDDEGNPDENQSVKRLVNMLVDDIFDNLMEISRPWDTSVKEVYRDAYARAFARKSAKLKSDWQL